MFPADPELLSTADDLSVDRLVSGVDRVQRFPNARDAGPTERFVDTLADSAEDPAGTGVLGHPGGAIPSGSECRVSAPNPREKRHFKRCRVLEVNRPNRQDRRLEGKSDPVDAEAAARAALSGRAKATP